MIAINVVFEEKKLKTSIPTVFKKDSLVKFYLYPSVKTIPEYNKDYFS